jgi:hypothetical protein
MGTASIFSVMRLGGRVAESTYGAYSATGAVTIHRRHNKPALGPVGDSLDDLQENRSHL